MAKEAKKYKVTIFGDSYSIVSDESEEHITNAARFVDTQMHDIAERLGSTDGKKLAVLTSLLAASKLLHLELFIDQEQQIKNRMSKEVDKALEL